MAAEKVCTLKGRECTQFVHRNDTQKLCFCRRAADIHEMKEASLYTKEC